MDYSTACMFVNELTKVIVNCTNTVAASISNLAAQQKEINETCKRDSNKVV